MCIKFASAYIFYIFCAIQAHKFHEIPKILFKFLLVFVKNTPIHCIYVPPEWTFDVLFQTHFPMELHAVHFNTKFGSSLIEALSNAGNAYNALAVLSVMFQVQEEDNPLIQPIVDGKAKELDLTIN